MKGKKKAKAIGLSPDSLWEGWTYSFEIEEPKSVISPEERAAEERAAAELRKLGKKGLDRSFSSSQHEDPVPSPKSTTSSSPDSISTFPPSPPSSPKKRQRES